MNSEKRHTFRMDVLLLLVAALLGFTWLTQGDALAAPVTLNLWAKAGSTSLPDGTSVTVWGYTDSADATLTSPGGPTLIVNQGDVITVNLTNDLTEPTALIFQGQAMVPDAVGAPASDGTNPGTKSYTFTATNPGTYLYEAGLLPNAQHQVAMGLFGALVVRPPTAGQAYSSAATAYDVEAVLVLSDIDPALNDPVAPATPATFDMRNYAPKYFLINGKAYPATAPIPITFPNTNDRKVLLRYVNAGLQAYSMTLLGLRQNAIAMDGNPFGFARTVVAESIAPGQTADMIVSVPATTADGTKFALYDGNLMLHNNVAGGIGGILTFLTVTNTPPTLDTTGPATSGVTLTPTLVTATVSDAGRGDSNVTRAEFFVDTTGANGSGTAMYTSLPNTFTPGITVSVSGTMPALATGSHTVYVHGMDVANNWGPFQSAVILVDTTGPTTSALGLSPDPTNGTVAVALSATANDTATGGSNIAAAEYTIDSGAYTSMTVSPSGVKIASLTASIPAATVNGLTPEGTHVVSVRSQDSLGNWGSPPATINLIVDKTGPVTSNVTVANASPAGVRVRADFADTLSNINRAEGYVDNDPGVGKGFVFTAIDGLFNSKSEPGYADMPQSIFNTLGSGTHSVFVRAKDAAGNWGSTSSTVFVLFADGFESGDFTKWSTTGGTPGRISVTLGGQGGGTRKMQAAISSGTSGYVQDNTPANETSYRARFYFNPNGYTTGNGGNPTPVTIFSGLNTASATVFQVQYRRSSNTGYQVCLVVSRAGGGGGTTSTSWYTINNNAWNAIEIAWQSAASASASLYTGGTLRQTLTVLNTSGFTLDTVRLGPQGTGLPNSGTVYFDSFISTRNLYIGP